MAAWNGFLETFGDNRWIQSVVALGVTLAAAWIAGFVLSRGIARLARRTESDVDDRLIEILTTPIRASVVIVGLSLVTLRIDPSKLLEDGALDLTALTQNLLATVAILVWVVAGIRVAGLLLDAASGRSRFVEARTAPLFRNLANIVLVAAAVYFFFVAWGIDVTAWMASAGIVGIAVGFAAKDSLANLFAGFFILTDAPYKLGDFVNLDSGERGQVTHVGIRSTRLLTRDDVEITIPNAIMGTAKVVNESGGRWSKLRLRIKVGVAYGSDVDRVRGVLEGVGIADPDVCEDPAPRVRLRSFGESGLDFELLAWIEDPVDRGRVVDALNTAIYKRFAAEGIEIPFPKRDVYIRQMPSVPGG
ncbi:MAG TPA: mechanosensitive ion channel family protein [Thermoanaerobaculia bacterium]|nr:mechanosensitive ion channel family protein [Thermoanaerobaculia bacterium]